MYDKQLATILLVIVVLVWECRIHGGERRVLHGQLQRIESSAQKRMTYKKGDHLFNNLAKALTDMIRDVFWVTYLKSFCTAYPAKNEFIVVDTLAKGNDVTDQFPTMVNNYKEYKTDKLLTTYRDSLSVYGQKHEGPDENAKKWSNTIEELRKMVFKLINKTIKMGWSIPKKKKNKKKKGIEEEKRQQEIIEQLRNELNGLLQNLRNRIDQMISQGEYVDQDAKTVFTNDKQNAKRIPEMEAVEAHIQEAFRNLPDRVKQWALEATNFYRKKLK